MDFVPPQLDGAVTRNQTYALQGARDDTSTMEAQKIPRSFTNNLVANQITGPYRYFNTIGEHGWARYVLDEMKDMLLLLRPDGIVLYASPSCKSVTGYNAQQMEQNVLSRFIHDDDKQIFAYELEESIARARPLQCHFRFYRPNNTFCIMEAHGHPHITALTHACSGVFLVCRPYPTRTSTLLDSFLEHKIENIRLRQCIARLKEEEEEEELSPSRQEYTNGNPSQFYNSYDAIGSGDEKESPDSAYNDDSDSITFIRHDSEKLSPTEDTSHIDGIEVMTGLYYGDGERSQGLSTGLRNGRLVHCDIDMAALEQQAQAQAQARIAQDNSDRRKRLKGEYMCSDCGTSESPEWRKGPEGPKTLCNACGLRWAKREKKRQEPN